MRKCLLLFIALLPVVFAHAQKTAPDSFTIRTQNWQTDSLEALANASADNANKLALLNELGWRFAFNQPAKGLSAVQQALFLAKKLSSKRGQADAYQNAAWCQWALGDYAHALQYALQSLHLFEELKDSERIAWSYLTLANVYRDFGDYEKALQTAHRSIESYNAIHISARIALAIAASIYNLQNNLDSALVYLNRAEELDLRDNQGKWGWIQVVRGDVYRKLNQFDKALAFYRIALSKSELVNVKKDIVDIYNGMALVHQATRKVDSAIYYASQVLQQFSTISYQKGILDAINTLTAAYKAKNNKDSVIKYLDLGTALNNRLYNQKRQRDVQTLAFGEQIRQEELQREHERYRDRLRLYGLLGFGIIVLVVALLLWRNNRQKQKAFALVQQQKLKTERTYEQLKATQSQLIQREKMASLGELTAGIAHEIQNPLNFVNNFSEISKELVEELKQEADSGNTSEVKALADDVLSNLNKVVHHGRRADSIVKGMLQHSRGATGEKEPTELNTLVEQYLQLSYHGYRAKDKSFNADVSTTYDPTIEKVNLAPQDIGRVLLNLFNNAFYAVSEKKKLLNGTFEPNVSVTTKKESNHIVIAVKDNGVGMSQKVADKVFQPFFTTKPTGEGTGLGLSLSYDVVTKGHGGDLRVRTEEGQYTEFVVSLPNVVA